MITCEYFSQRQQPFQKLPICRRSEDCSFKKYLPFYQTLRAMKVYLPTKIKKLRIHQKALNKFEIIQQTKKWQVAWLSWMLYCLIRLPARLLRTTQIKCPKHSTKFAWNFKKILKLELIHMFKSVPGILCMLFH